MIVATFGSRNPFLTTSDELEAIDALRRYSLIPAYKLHSLLKRVDPTKLKPDTLNILKDISRRCEPCCKFGKKQISFQIGSIKEHGIVFNKEISVDILWIDNTPVLHVIDTGTRCSAAAFLTEKPIDSNVL